MDIVACIRNSVTSKSRKVIAGEVTLWVPCLILGAISMRKKMRSWEQLQRRTIKLVKGLEDKSYEELLKKVNIV